MNIQELTKQFAKKNIPDIRPGDTVKAHFKITESGKSRIQIFEGIVIAQKHGKGLDGTIKIRRIASGVGVERTFPLHSPLITKFEKVKSRKVRRSKLYFLRDLIGKRAKKVKEEKESGMWEEAISEEEIQRIEEEKAKAAAIKAEQKEKEKEELDKKFEAAAAAHKQVDLSAEAESLKAAKAEENPPAGGEKKEIKK